NPGAFRSSRKKGTGGFWMWHFEVLAAAPSRQRPAKSGERNPPVPFFSLNQTITVAALVWGGCRTSRAPPASVGRFLPGERHDDQKRDNDKRRWPGRHCGGRTDEPGGGAGVGASRLVLGRGRAEHAGRHHRFGVDG